MKTEEVFGKGRLRKNYYTEEWPGLQTSSALPGTDWKVYCSTAAGQRHFSETDGQLT